MIRRYSARDIEKWADYSGDRNKVHFDKAFAINNGLKDIIVQGMLTLLDAKVMITPWLKTHSSLDFYIKNPVSMNTDVQFTLKEGENKQTLTIAESQNPEAVCVTATLLAQKPPNLPKSATRIPISDEFIQMHLESLKSHYPHISHNWLLMDTLLFSICFNQRKDDYFHQQALKISKHHRYDNITTYHVAQKLFISEQLIVGGDINFSEISFFIEDKDIYIDNDSAYNIFNIHAVQQGAIIFQSSIGCMTKASRRELEI